MKNQRTKNIFGSALLIGGCALFFSVFTQASLKAEYGQITQVATVYRLNGQAAAPSIPEGYVQADYQVQFNPQWGEPGAQNISMEEAAEIGAQLLYQFFGLDLSGQAINMSYSPAEKSRRAYWGGEVRYNGHYLYYFTVDSITGERRGVYCWEKLDAEVSLGPDWSLADHCEPYSSEALTLVKQYGLLPAGMAEASYYAQGYTDNNPDVIVKVTNDEGQEVRFTYSRYNQKLMGIDFELSIQEMNKFEQEIEAQLVEETVEFDKQIKIMRENSEQGENETAIFIEEY